MSETVRLAAGWLGDLAEAAPEWMSDEQRERLARERARDLLAERREAEERAAAAEERADRLAVQARLSGRDPGGREPGEILHDAREQGEREDRREDRERSRLVSAGLAVADALAPYTATQAWQEANGRGDEQAARAVRERRLAELAAAGPPRTGRERAEIWQGRRRA